MLSRLRRLAWGHSPDIDTLSERIDGRLTQDRAREVDAHVAGCDVCESALSEMREARALLAAMPEAAAPRSFRLRQADVEAPARVPAAGSSMMRWAPALSGAAVMVFVGATAFGVLTTGGSGSAQLAATQADAPVGSLEADRGGAAARSEATGSALIASPTIFAAAAAPDSIAPTASFNQTERPAEPAPAGESAAGSGPPGTPAEDSSIQTPQAAVGAVEPTGEDAAASGDSGLAEDGGDSSTDSFAPPPAPATSAPVGVAPDINDNDQSEAIEKTVADDDDDGNWNALLVVQVTAAIVAIVAAAGYVAWRVTRGGVSG